MRAALGPALPVAVKLNATDGLDGGLGEAEALEAVAALDAMGIDLIDISGGTYFPGARPASARSGGWAYFRAFARAARERATTPLMLTGGIKTRAQALAALGDGTADMIGLARALDPALPRRWRGQAGGDPAFPRFDDPPEGAVTAWYTQRLRALGEDREAAFERSARGALADYRARDAARVPLWNARFAA